MHCSLRPSRMPQPRIVPTTPAKKIQNEPELHAAGLPPKLPNEPEARPVSLRRKTTKRTEGHSKVLIHNDFLKKRETAHFKSARPRPPQPPADFSRRFWHAEGEMEAAIWEPAGLVATPRRPSTPDGKLRREAVSGYGPVQTERRRRSRTPGPFGGLKRCLRRSHSSKGAANQLQRTQLGKRTGDLSIAPNASKPTAWLCTSGIFAARAVARSDTAVLVQRASRRTWCCWRVEPAPKIPWRAGSIGAGTTASRIP
jgi:hypothetical protein